MRMLHIAFCTQIYAHERGYCADDHIYKYCTVTRCEPGSEFEAAAIPLIETIDRLAEECLYKASEEWMKANPNELECCGEGEEFVGLTWLEHSFSNYEEAPPWVSSNEDVIRRLLETLKHLQEC